MAPPTRRGFTLLEVLTAAAMTAALAAGLYGSLHAAFRARDATVAQLEAARAARLAFALIERDLRAALPPRGRLAAAFTGTDARDSTGADADTLTFHNTIDSPAPPTGAGDVQAVSFALVTAAYAQAGAGNRLVRSVTRQLLAPYGAPAREQTLCRQVTSLNFRFFSGSAWIDAWDSAARANTLPLAVEVTLTLAPPQPRSQPYRMTRIFPLPCAAPLAAEEDGS